MEPLPTECKNKFGLNIKAHAQRGGDSKAKDEEEVLDQGEDVGR